MDSRKIRRELAAAREQRPVSSSPPMVTLTRGDGAIQVRRGSKGEELLRKAGWREAAR